MQGSTGATEEDGFKLWRKGGLLEMLCIEKLRKNREKWTLTCHVEFVLRTCRLLPPMPSWISSTICRINSIPTWALGGPHDFFLSVCLYVPTVVEGSLSLSLN